LDRHAPQLDELHCPPVVGVGAGAGSLLLVKQVLNFPLHEHVGLKVLQSFGTKHRPQFVIPQMAEGEGARVGATVGDTVGERVGLFVGTTGLFVGEAVGLDVGAEVTGLLVGAGVMGAQVPRQIETVACAIPAPALITETLRGSPFTVAE
jgi:hypothetical protein